MRTLGLGKSSHNPIAVAKHWTPTRHDASQRIRSPSCTGKESSDKFIPGFPRDAPSPRVDRSASPKSFANLSIPPQYMTNKVKESSDKFIPGSPRDAPSPRVDRSASPKSVVNLSIPSQQMTNKVTTRSALVEGIKSPDITRKRLVSPKVAVHSSPRAGTKHRPSLAVQNDLLNSPLASRRGFSFVKKADLTASPFSPTYPAIASQQPIPSQMKKQKWIATPNGIKAVPPPPPPAKCFDWKATVLSPKPNKSSLQRPKRLCVPCPPMVPLPVHNNGCKLEKPKNQLRCNELPPSIFRRNGKFSGSTQTPETQSDEDEWKHPTFSDQIETIDTYQVPAEEFSLFFYDHEEIAQFRHDAFAEELGLDASDYCD